MDARGFSKRPLRGYERNADTVKKRILTLFIEYDLRVRAVFTVFRDKKKAFVGGDAVTARAVFFRNLIAEINFVIVQKLDRPPVGERVFEIDKRAAERVQFGNRFHIFDTERVYIRKQSGLCAAACVRATSAAVKTLREAAFRNDAIAPERFAARFGAAAAGLV